MSTKKIPSRFDVSVEVEGKTHTGYWYGEKGCITVNYGFASKSTLQGNMPPETLARILLREIVTERNYE